MEEVSIQESYAPTEVLRLMVVDDQMELRLFGWSQPVETSPAVPWGNRACLDSCQDLFFGSAQKCGANLGKPKSLFNWWGIKNNSPVLPLDKLFRGKNLTKN